jgi:hypothetical protein
MSSSPDIRDPADPSVAGAVAGEGVRDEAAPEAAAEAALARDLHGAVLGPLRSAVTRARARHAEALAALRVGERNDEARTGREDDASDADAADEAAAALRARAEAYRGRVLNRVLAPLLDAVQALDVGPALAERAQYADALAPARAAAYVAAVRRAVARTLAPLEAAWHGWMHDAFAPHAVARAAAALDARLSALPLPPSAGAFADDDVPDVPADAASPLSETVEEAWAVWHRHAAQGLDACYAVADLHARLAALDDELLMRTHRAVQPLDDALRRALATLRRLHDALDDDLAAPPDDAELPDAAPPDAETRTPLAAWRERLEAIYERATAAVEHDVMALLRSYAPHDALRDGLNRHAEHVRDVVTSVPEVRRLHRAPDAIRVSPDAVYPPRPRRVRLPVRPAARSATLHLTDTDSRELAERLRRTLDEVERAAGIVRFNLRAALDELDAWTPDEEDDGGPPYALGDALDAAQTLTREGLTRARAVLDGKRTRLHQALVAFNRAARAAYDDAHAVLQERLHLAHRERGRRLRRLQLWLGDRGRVAGRGLTQRATRLRQSVRLAWRATRRRARRLVEMGQTAVRAGADDEMQAALEALAGHERRLTRLPLTYRRLFSETPLDDAALLAGREADTERVRRHLAQWTDGLTNALILSGARGSGHTTFVRVLARTVFADERVTLLALDARPASEAALAARLARALDLDLGPAHPDNAEPGGPAPTLGDVQEALPPYVHGHPVSVCLVLGLEHLFLGTVGGARLMRRFLTFMSQTDDRVLWVGTLSDLCWQVVAKAIPGTSGLVMRHELARLGRDDLEAAVMLRHRRSGLPLRFVRMADGRTADGRDAAEAVRRGWQRMPSQADLQRQFFSRLHEVCGPNVTLALFYWVRAAHYDADTGTLVIRPLRPLSFGFLDTLSLPQQFTLKAFLDHATLTVAEHGAVARVSHGTSLELLESLSNVLLIEPAPPTDGPRRPTPDTRPPDAAIDDATRYRLRPVVVRPVIEHLRRTHIIH